MVWSVSRVFSASAESLGVVAELAQGGELELRHLRGVRIFRIARVQRLDQLDALARIRRLEGGSVNRVLGIDIDLFGVIDAFLPVLDLFGVRRLRRRRQLARNLRSPVGPLADEIRIFLGLGGFQALVGGIEIVGVHGEQFLAGLDDFVGRSGFDIACLHLLVDPTDGVVLGALRRELLQQRKLFGLVGLLADLLEQQAFRRLGVNRAQRMALGQRGAAGDNQCENQDAKSHFRPPFPRNSNTLYNGATVNLPNASFVLRFGPVRDNRIRPDHSGCQTGFHNK